MQNSPGYTGSVNNYKYIPDKAVGYKEKPINSNNLQDSDKVKLDKRQEKEELSLTQRLKDVNKSFVFSESMPDEFL